MPDYELVMSKPGQPAERYAVPAGGLVIGRNEDCGLVLTDQLVSRRHVKLTPTGEGVQAKDLGSSNGIEINGVSTREGVLHEGDSLQVGRCIFRLALKSDSELGRSIISAKTAEEIHKSMVVGAADTRMLVLYHAAQLLGRVFDEHELLDEILRICFDALPARRGFVLVRPAVGREPEVRATKSLEADDDGPPLSHTLIQHVFDTQDAMLTLDAQSDSRFDMAQSIVSHDIHAAMCAPLVGRHAPVGAIYVDSGSKPGDRPFSKTDLELLSAIARVVGVAVENAHLYQETVRQERMAALGEATAGLGHCIKNILTALRGGTEFVNMALEKDDIKYLQKGWPILSHAIDRIDNLVLNMLSFSKDREPTRAATDVNQLANEITAMLLPRAQKYKVNLTVISDKPAWASIDSREIYRVLMNITLNAVEACVDTGGNITINCASDEHGCVICVSDDGPGIPDDILPRLSEAFVSSKGSSGTGLGLAVSYKIVQEHDGRIDVKTGKGQGTIFTVSLPGAMSVPTPGRMTQRIEE